MAACNDMRPPNSKGVRNESNQEDSEPSQDFPHDFKYQLDNFIDETAVETPVEITEECGFCDESENYSQEDANCLTDDIDF